MSNHGFDAIIIGGGHNGLVAATYLGKGGLRPLVLDKNAVIGGMCTTQEFPGMPPGFKFNVGCLIPAGIRGPITEELELESRFGLEWLDVDPSFWLPFPDGKFWRPWKDPQKLVEEIRRVARDHDADAFVKFSEYFGGLGMLVGSMYFGEPPSFKDLVGLLPDGLEGTELVRTLLMSANHVVDEWFDTDYLKGPIVKFVGSAGIDARDQASGFLTSFFTTLAREGPAKGGAGSVTQALAKAAGAAGADIRLNTVVDKILVENGQAVGVRLQGGEEIRAKVVISTLDAVRVFTQLLDPNLVEERLLRRLRALRADRYGCFYLHLALNELPDYSAKFPGYGPELASSAVIICPSTTYNDAFQSSINDGRIPEHPVFWGETPSVADPSLAPAGKYTMTIGVYAANELADGRSWDEARETLADNIVNELAAYAPNIKKAIIARHSETPPEMVEHYGALDGNLGHLDFKLSQLLMFRPLPELANYRTPIANLYLSGAGTHPMGTVIGIPGFNTAHAVLKDLGAGTTQSSS